LYYLTARSERSTLDPAWGPVEEPYGWDDVGVTGPGPDLVLIPPSAEPGRYRVCTANAGNPQFCSEFDVAAG
jgi:hypothetical protein